MRCSRNGVDHTRRFNDIAVAVANLSARSEVGVFEKCVGRDTHIAQAGP